MLFSILSDQSLNGIFSTYKHFQDITLECISFPHPHKHNLYLDLDVTPHTHHLLCECTHRRPWVDPTSMDVSLNLHSNDPEHQATFSFGFSLQTALLWGTCLTFTPEYRCLSESFLFYSGLHPPYPQTLDFLTMKYKLKAEFYHQFSLLFFALYPYFFFPRFLFTSLHFLNNYNQMPLESPS